MFRRLRHEFAIRFVCHTVDNSAAGFEISPQVVMGLLFVVLNVFHFGIHLIKEKFVGIILGSENVYD